MLDFFYVETLATPEGACKEVEELVTALPKAGNEKRGKYSSNSFLNRLAAMFSFLDLREAHPSSFVSY